MKKIQKHLASILAFTVVLSLFPITGCQKHDPEGSDAISSTGSSTVIESTSATTENSSETTVGTTSAAPESSTSAPDTTAPSGVKAHWDNYRPVVTELPDPVMHWIDEDHPSDFVPSSDYGRIFFYHDTMSYGYYGPVYGSAGCIDINGRVICKPFVDGYWPDDYNDPHGYIVKKGEKCGFLALDGSFYSGLIYDKTVYDKAGNFRFIKYTSDGLTVSPYDVKTGESGDPLNLHFDHKAIPDNMSLAEIILDRYLLFTMDDYESDEDPYGSGEDFLIDAKTGRKIPVLRNQFIVGNAFLKEEKIGDEDWSEDTMFTYTLTDFSGNQLWQKTYGRKYIVSDDRILFRTTEGYDLLDLSGNLIGTLKKGDEYVGNPSEHPFIEVLDSKICLYVSQPSDGDSYKCTTYFFDKDLHLIRSESSEDNTSGNNNIVYENIYDEKTGQDITTVTNTQNGNKTSFTGYAAVNPASSADYVIVRTDPDDPTVNDDDFIYSYKYHFLDPNDFTEKKVLKGYINNEYDLSKGLIILQHKESFQLIDGKDFHVIKEMEGVASPLSSFSADHKDFVLVGDQDPYDPYADAVFLDLLDSSTGNSILTGLIPDEYASLIDSRPESIEIYTDTNRFFYHGKNCYMLFNEKGEVLFLSYIFRGDQDHYQDDSFYYDEEPDSP